MNYSKEFNTTKKAIAEIKRLEKECARLAGLVYISSQDHKKEIETIKKDHKIKCESIENGSEVSRLQASIVQFRKTQDYQSDKIGELQSEKREWIMDEAKYKKRIETFKLNAENASETYNHQRWIISDMAYKTNNLNSTIIRQANEITELKASN